MGNIFQFAWEVKLIESIQSLIKAAPFLKTVFSFFTMLGESTPIVLIIMFVYLCINKKIGIKIAINSLVAMGVVSMVKNVFKRIRPYSVNESIECYKTVEKGYDIHDMSKQGFSFPSGHSAISSSVFQSVYLERKDKVTLIVGILIVFAICLSRIALGVHYPTDVLVGLFIGFTTPVILDKLDLLLNKKVYYLAIILFSSIGIFYCKSNDYYSVLGLLLGFCSGDLFEEKYVQFENTHNIIKMILRIAGAAVIFLGISSLLKMPFSTETLEAHNLFAYLYRVFRYAISSFTVIGLYPILIKKNIFKLKD